MEAIDVDLVRLRPLARTGRQLHRGSAETKKLRRTRYRPSIFGTSGAILGVLGVGGDGRHVMSMLEVMERGILGGHIYLVC